MMGRLTTAAVDIDRGVFIAERIEECSKLAKVLYGAAYRAEVMRFRDRIVRIMTDNDIGIVSAAVMLLRAGRDAGDFAGFVTLMVCAAVYEMMKDGDSGAKK